MSNVNNVHDIQPNALAMAVVEASVLDNLFVSSCDVKDPDSPAPDQHGYQRPADPSRNKAIAAYYQKNPNLVTPVIVSARVKEEKDIADIKRMIEQGNWDAIGRKYGPHCLSIIDAQHRRNGLLEAVSQNPDFGQTRVPVLLYFGMDYVKEAEVFNTVNSSQRKLPKAQVEYTKGDITERLTNDHNQRIRNLALGLARDSDSPFAGQINLTGQKSKTQSITYEGLRRSMYAMFPAELLGRLDTKNLSALNDIAKPYWKEIGSIFPTEWKGPGSRVVNDPVSGTSETVPIYYRLKELVGLAALSRLGKDIISSALEANDQLGVPIPDAMKKRMALLRHVDWEKNKDNPWMASQAGFAGQSQLHGDLYRLVYSSVDPDGNTVK